MTKDTRTPEERYRALCMLMLVFRYGYYVRSKHIITEGQYNAFDGVLKDFEATFPELVHPKSPTQTVGSDRPEHYPRSVVNTWEAHEETGGIAHWAVDLDSLLLRTMAFLEGVKRERQCEDR